MDYNSKTRPELIILCKERKIKGYSGKTKSGIISMLELDYKSVDAKGEEVKPFLKWVGGKTQIIEQIFGLFTKDINNYHEPFLGGGSVLLTVLSAIKRGDIAVSGTVYASDLNPALIGVYKNIQAFPLELIDEVNKLVVEFKACGNEPINRAAEALEDAQSSQEAYYFWIRSIFNKLPLTDKVSCAGSAMFLFMNKTCFRGVYREGPRGFNVPFGNYNNPTIIDKEHILAVSVLIQNVVFTTKSFDAALSIVVDGDFVYMDPPYAQESAKSFTSYMSGGFSLDNHKSLFGMCHGFTKRGIKFLLSNSNVNLVKDAFPSPLYNTRIISCRRAINSTKPESKTNEVLITN